MAESTKDELKAHLLSALKEAQSLIDEFRSEKCDNCGRIYSSIYHLPDALWAKLTEDRDDLHLLCPECCNFLADKKGIMLYWEAAEEHYPTLFHDAEETCD